MSLIWTSRLLIRFRVPSFFFREFDFKTCVEIILSFLDCSQKARVRNRPCVRQVNFIQSLEGDIQVLVPGVVLMRVSFAVCCDGLWCRVYVFGRVSILLLGARRLFLIHHLLQLERIALVCPL
jgi:hypothetical protein